MNLGDFFYSILKTPIRWYFELTLNTKEGVNEAKNYPGPLLMIGPHVALEDSLLAVTYRRTLVRFLASDANWDMGFRNAAFKLFNVIPFHRQRLDVRAIRKLKQSVNEGHSVGLFPEGARTWDGKTLKVIPSIAKLIKLLRVPVYNITYSGLYLTRPRWAGKNTRRGRIDVSIRRILSKEEVKNATNAELLKKIEAAIAFNEFDWQRKAMVPFKGKRRAEHIEHLLYRCPSCDAVNSLWSSGNTFSCDQCGTVYTVNQYGFIEGSDRFDNTVDWHAWQQSRLVEILKSDFRFEQKNMKVDRIVDEVLRPGNADVVLTPKKLDITFEDGENVRFALSDIRSCDAIFSNCVEFYVQEIKYRFLFEPEKKHMSLKLFEDIILASYKKPKENPA